MIILLTCLYFIGRLTPLNRIIRSCRISYRGMYIYAYVYISHKLTILYYRYLYVLLEAINYYKVWGLNQLM